MTWLLRSIAILFLFSFLAVAPAAFAGDVGVRSFLVSDATRTDSLQPAQPREWMVDVYYPTTSTQAAGPYFDDPVLLQRLIDEQYYGQTKEALQAWANQFGAAVRNAPQADGRLPLIVILPGFGVVRANYQFLASAFVARGFVVAVIDVPYLGEQRLPDGRVLSANDDPMAQSNTPEDYAPRIREFVRDVSLTLDQLGEHVAYDPAAITVTGHSSGGAVAVDVCNADVRVSACVNWEGGIEPTQMAHDGAKKPTLIGVSRAGGRPEAPHDATHPDMLSQDLADMDKGGCRSCWVLKVTSGSHMSYSDAPQVMPDTLSRFGGDLITSERSFTLYSGITAAFARAYAPGGGGDAAFAAAIQSEPEITRAEKSPG